MSDIIKELENLEANIPEDARDLTVDNILYGFNNHYMIDRILEVCGELDLQFDLLPYGFKEYRVSRSACNREDEYLYLEELRKLRKASALMKAKASNTLTFRTTDGLFTAVADKHDAKEVLLKIFESETNSHVASVLIGDIFVQEDGSYYPQTVIMRYMGEFIGKSGQFYEAVEQLENSGKVVKLNFGVYSSNEGAINYLTDFSSTLDLLQISSNEIIPQELSYDKRDYVRGMSVGLHPERVSKIVSEEYPSGTSKKRGTLQ